MVERLKLLLNQVRTVIKGMAPSQRLTMAIGGVLVFASLSILVALSTRTDYEFLVDVAQLSQEEKTNLIDLISSEGIDWELDGNVLSVEDGSRKAIVMKLNLEKKMPNNRLAFQWLYDQTPLNTPGPKALEEKLRLSRAVELEGVLDEIAWVHSSKVVITEGNDLDPLQPRRHPTKAMVHIHTKTKKVDQEDVESVRTLVTYAIPKLKDKYVGIVIDDKPYIFKNRSEDLKESDEWTAREVAVEEHYENKLEHHFLGEAGEFALFRKIRVTVHTELDRDLIKSHVRTTREDSNPVRTTQFNHKTVGRGNGVQEVGVFDETSVTENTFAGTEAQLFTDDESSTTIENLPAIEETVQMSKIPGVVKKLSVAMVFDIDEMTRPTSADIENQVPPEDILERNLAVCRKQAIHALGLMGSFEENITVNAMQFAWDELPEAPKVGEVLLNILEKSGGQFLVFGLSLFGFLYFVNILRQAFETPEMEQEMDEEEIKRRTTEEDVARMLDSQEQDATDIRAKQIEERVIEFVSENPDSAASLIKRWLIEDDSGSGKQ